MQFPVSVYFFCLAALFLVYIYIYIFFLHLCLGDDPPLFLDQKYFRFTSFLFFEVVKKREEEGYANWTRRKHRADHQKISPAEKTRNIVCCASRNFFSPRGEIIQRHILEWPTSAFARANSWLFAIRYYSLLPATGYGRLLFVFSQLAQSNNSLMFYKLL